MRNKMRNEIDRGKSAFGLTASDRGWYRRVNKSTRWICSFNAAPNALDADKVFAKRFPEMLEDRPTRDAITLGYVCDAFDAWKRDTVGFKTMRDYTDILTKFMAHVGKGRMIADLSPEDFTSFARTFVSQSISRREKFVVCVRTLFNFAIEQGWLQSMRYGPAFKQPRKKEKRIDAAKRPRRMYTPAEIRVLLGTQNLMLRAAILLGINGGLGNKEIAMVKRDRIVAGVLDYDRAKTGAERRVPLWPETVAALKKLKANAAGLLFYTAYGTPMVSDTRDSLSIWFNEWCKKCKVRNLGFYSLRRTFRTVVDELPDTRAVALVMGHTQKDMGSIYVQHVDPSRLVAVTEHVRSWLALPGVTSGASLPSASLANHQPASKPVNHDSSDTIRQ